MTALLILAMVLALLGGGLVVFRALDFPEIVDEGRVDSWPRPSTEFHRTDYVTRATLQRLREER